MNETAGLAAFFAAVAGLGLIIFFIAAVLWVLKSMGLSQMAENLGVENAWLAWLPVADLYIMGTIVEEMTLFNLQITNLGLWFPVICLLGGLLTGIPFLGVILFIGLLIFQIAFIYKLFSLYTDQAVVYTVLSIFFAFLWPIFIFSLRNHPVMKPAAGASGTNPAENQQNVNGNNDYSFSADAYKEETDNSAETVSQKTAVVGPDEREQQI